MSNDRQRLITAARRLLPSRADAEDAVQDTYVRSLAALNGASPEPAWMYTVLKNVAIDRLRRQQLEAEHAATEPVHERSSEDVLKLRADCEGALRHLLARTSLTEAAAILLRDVFEFDYAEIARLVGKTETTCRQFLKRARTRTRRTEASTEAEENHVRWCWQAIEARNPTRLIDIIQMRATLGKGPPAPVKAQRGGRRSYSTLVQVNGRYALALMLDGVVLCVVPIGTQTALESAAFETC
ncbi:MAG TPA: sigma-70 family RNA polymerase sigma factor [Steroidobacteraceae bacterium]|jgi:RNA polymerase sigma-70 factor (ECF subfamily)